MLHYSDLTVGEVSDYDPDKMCGHVKITSEDDPRLGSLVWFSYDDGVFLSTDGHGVNWGEQHFYEGVGPSKVDAIFSTDWNGGYGVFDPQRRLKVPEKGDELVFWIESSDSAQHKAKPWTYANYYKHRALSIAPQYTIDLPRVAWWEEKGWRGRYSLDLGLYLTEEGTPPDDKREDYHFADHTNCEVPIACEEGYIDGWAIANMLIDAKPFFPQ